MILMVWSPLNNKRKKRKGGIPNLVKKGRKPLLTFTYFPSHNGIKKSTIAGGS